jgi:hypothetical protein
VRGLLARIVLGLVLTLAIPLSAFAQGPSAGPMTECPSGDMMDMADMMAQMQRMMMDMGDMMANQPMEGMTDPTMESMMMSMSDQTMAMGEMMGSMHDEIMAMMGCP